MSSDDSDKTVFKQPAFNGEQTVVTPMPGGRPGARGTPRQESPSRAAGQMPSGRPGNHSQRGTSSQHTPFEVSAGLNPLLNCAATLIAVYEKTRHSATHPDVGGLHQRLSNEIRDFESKARELGYRQEVLLSARYFLCATLDEGVLNTPWGSESPWAQRTLLSVFHNETSGGEKCFLILDRMRQAPADNVDILELIYVCLSLGFEGKFRFQDRGRDHLDRIKDDLFSSLRLQRGEYERTLSSNWKGLGNVSRSLAHYIPMWVVASVVLGLLFFGYSGFRYWMYESSSPVVETLENILPPEETDEPR